MSLYIPSQDGPGELYQELLRAAPIAVSSDKSNECTAAVTRDSRDAPPAQGDTFPAASGEIALAGIRGGRGKELGSSRRVASWRPPGEPAHRHPIDTRGGGASLAPPDDGAAGREVAAQDAWVQDPLRKKPRGEAPVGLHAASNEMGQVPPVLGTFACDVHGFTSQRSLLRLHQVPLSRFVLLRLHGQLPLASLGRVARACDRSSSCTLLIR